MAILLFCTITELTGRALRAVIWYFHCTAYPDDPDMNSYYYGFFTSGVACFIAALSSYYPFSWFKIEPDPWLHFFWVLLFWWLVNNQLVDRRFSVTAQRVGAFLGLLANLSMEW